MVEESIFPPPSSSFGEQGFLAVSRNVNPDMLLDSYSCGIFPWPEREGEVLWCSPPERGVLFLEKFHISKSLLRSCRNSFHFTFYVNRNFPSVIKECSLTKRKGQDDTWITKDLIPSYIRLHEMGIAHSFEAYTPDVCILDFRDVSFVDSSGIAVVINAMRNMTQIEGKLLLTGISPQPMRVFRASGIDKLVEIREAVS